MIDTHLREIRPNHFVYAIAYTLSWERQKNSLLCVYGYVYTVRMHESACVFRSAKLCLFIYKAVARGDCVLYGLLYAVASVHCEEAVCVGTASLW